MSNNNLNLSIVPYGPAELPDRTVYGVDFFPLKNYDFKLQSMYKLLSHK